MAKYFGTDGIRGRYGDGITEEIAFKTGLALGTYFDGCCFVGRDTRDSGQSLMLALIKGLNYAGRDAKVLGIVPTPLVSLLATGGAGYGVMITASHNPPQYNGIKVFDCNGVKLDDDEEKEIEYLIDNPQIGFRRGKAMDYDGAIDFYINTLCRKADRLDGLKICIDAGFGACQTIAKQVFESLGASVTSINDLPIGEKINHQCGALYIDTLKERCNDGNLCFAFDGDADRVSMLCDGDVLDGDSVLYTLSRVTELKDDVVVGTVMSNLALESALKADKKTLIKTAVGDKYILDRLKKDGYSLGGEQSGHYIFYPNRLTGDGILTALNMSYAYAKNKIKRLDLMPQKTVSIYAHPSALDDKNILGLIDKHKKRLKYLLVRMSGTEPKLRIMAQDKSMDKIDKALCEFQDALMILRKSIEIENDLGE